MEEATRRHFFEHGDPEPDDPTLQQEQDDCHWCQLRALPTAETYPVTVVNDKDDAKLPSNFRFLQHSVLAPDVEVAEDSFRSGCECEDDAECQYNQCLCLQEQDEAGSKDEDDDPHAGKKVYRYHTHGAKAGLLKNKFLDTALPIYECHEGCKCSEACPNRVVQRGRKVPLQIFRTSKTGWGVRALADVRQGQLVDKYIGEIITPREAQRRRDASEVAQRKDIYLFGLDKFTDQDSPDPRLRGQPLEVDGEFMSGPTRFINHSCEPNLRIFARVGDHADKHVHDVALFAIRDIARGEELTFDYLGKVSEDQDWSDHQHMLRCLCGSKKCRGFLF